MAKERSGYVFEERGRWYARLTYTNERGQRKNVKRRAARLIRALGVSVS